MDMKSNLNYKLCYIYLIKWLYLEIIDKKKKNYVVSKHGTNDRFV